MHAANWIYLFDHEGGGPKPPQTLPKHINETTMKTTTRLVAFLTLLPFVWYCSPTG